MTVNNVLTSPDFQALTKKTVTGAPTPNPPAAPTPAPPLANPATNAINMFFVNSIVPTPASTIYGFSWINGNGIAIAGNTTFPTLGTPRFDNLAHEIGHVLRLDHTTFGARGLNNVMTTGTTRSVPSSSGCSTALMGGAIFDVDTDLCPAAPAVPIDQLILGTSTNTQQGQALASGFMVPVANVPASATAGGGAAATAAALTTARTAGTAPASTSSAINFNVTYPKFIKSGGRSADEFIVALILALPDGFQFGNPAFSNPGGTAAVFGTPQVLNGNNGQGNVNCLKPITGAPSIQCLEIDFTVTEDSSTTPSTFTGSFTTDTSFSFSSVILKKGTGQPATLADLTSQCTTPGPLQCLNITYVFKDLFATTSFFGLSTKTGSLTANSQLPNAAVASTIVDPSAFVNLPAVYPSFAGIIPLGATTPTPCTLTGGAKSCPPGILPQGVD